MSQTNVKSGFVIGESVPVSKIVKYLNYHQLMGVKAETFSAQDMIKSRFTNHEALTELEDLMNEIFIRRAEHVPGIPYVARLHSHAMCLKS